MRIFWAIIGVLILAAGVLWFVRSQRTQAPAPELSSTAINQPDPAQAPQPSAAPASPSPVATTPAQVPPRIEANVPTPVEPKPQPAPTAAAQAPEPAEPVPAPASETAAAPAEPPSPQQEPIKPSKATVEAIRDDLTSLIGGDDLAIKPVVPKPSLEEHSGPTPTVTSSVPAAAASAGAPPTDPNAKAKLEPQTDGSTLVDGRFVIKGAGTKSDPYRVTWEMLLSSQESYQPRLGRKIIPDRVKMLDGKWVKISGYIAFPLMAQSNDEMLMMLNQWDGCCIGVPPTPYDAIEVRLKKAAVGEERLKASGTILGILRVDPYLVKDWLVSLYLMDDGELTDTGGEVAPGQHEAK